MKIKISKSESGGILMLALTITTLLTLLTLASYFLLAKTQSRYVSRSQSWNSSIPAAEAGVEEALQHLNYNCVSNLINGGRTAFTADGWTATNSGGYSGIGKQHVTYGDNADYYYDVVVWTNDLMHPEINAVGYAPAVAMNHTGPMFAAVGARTGMEVVQRSLKVLTDPISVFQKALLTKGPMNLNGNGVAVDSFDPSLTPGGRYDINFRNSKGDIATAQITNALGVGGANIYGTVSTPYGGNVSVANNGAVGSVEWQEAGGTGIQQGWSRDDLNVKINDASLPNGFNPVTMSGSGMTFTNITTNYTAATNVSTTYPSPPYSYVVTNTTPTVTSSLPPSQPYIGSIQTNTVITNSVSKPSTGSYTGLLTTNTATVTAATVPGAGTYIGSISTNVDNNVTSPNKPADGTYIAGSLKQKGNGDWQYDQYKYTYSSITGYSYSYITGYTYNRITSYGAVNLTTPVYSTNIDSYQYVFPSGDWQVADITGNVLVTGNARVLVTGSINIAGQKSIKINNGASLTIYMQGADASIKGQGVANDNADARTFSYVGLPSNTSVAIGGNGQFTGTIYAPQAALSLGGGGSNDIDFTGAAVVNTVHMNGHFKLHFPEDLAARDPISAYVVKLWVEN